MDTKNSILSICDSLYVLGQQKAAEDIRMIAEKGRPSLEDLSSCLRDHAARFSNERFERYARRAKIGNLCSFDDIIDSPDRKLDMEYICELNSLDFIRNGFNLVIWGPPGTGKSWIARMIATSACAAGLRTRWTSFPVLYDQLLRIYRNTDGQTLESKIMYYSRFDLLCIDEFPNVSEMDPFLVHQIFNTFSERGHSILLCMQCQPEKMEELLSITSIGQSIKGRILQRAKRLHLSGSDLRLTDIS